MAVRGTGPVTSIVHGIITAYLQLTEQGCKRTSQPTYLNVWKLGEIRPLVKKRKLYSQLHNMTFPLSALMNSEITTMQMSEVVFTRHLNDHLRIRL